MVRRGVFIFRLKAIFHRSIEVNVIVQVRKTKLQKSKVFSQILWYKAKLKEAMQSALADQMLYSRNPALQHLLPSCTICSKFYCSKFRANNRILHNVVSRALSDS